MWQHAVSHRQKIRVTRVRFPIGDQRKNLRFGGTVSAEIEKVPFDCLDAKFRGRLDHISQTATLNSCWGKAQVETFSFESIANFEGVSVFVARDRVPSQITGFSVGTILSPPTRKFFGLEQLSSAGSKFEPRDGDYHLTWRAVLPEFRNGGIGLALTNVRIQDAERNQSSNVVGETIGTNSGTIAMHRCMGFETYFRTFHQSSSRMYERCYFRMRINHTSKERG
ncbi:MAG: GNAT family N-acetyltransferase [Pirellulaceae bacterium]